MFHTCTNITVVSCGVGCGLSLLGEDMAADGYRFLQALDYSETCIKVQSQLCCFMLVSLVPSCFSEVNSSSMCKLSTADNASSCS